MNPGIENAIVKAIELRAADIAEEEAKAAAERVKQRVKELAPIVAASIHREMDFQHYADRVVVTIRLSDKTR